MGLFGKLKQMVGISGIKVNLVLPQTSYKQGETISGVIRITGGPEPKMANKLSVALVEDFPEITVRTTSPSRSENTEEDTDCGSEPEATVTEASEKGEETGKDARAESLTSQRVSRQEIIVAQQFEIPPGAALEYPVSLNLPPEAAVTGPNQEWRLKTALDLAGALDTSDTDEITKGKIK